MCRHGLQQLRLGGEKPKGLPFAEWLWWSVWAHMVEKMILFIWGWEGKNSRLSSLSRTFCWRRWPHLTLVIILVLFLHWKMNIGWWAFAQMGELMLFIEVSLFILVCPLLIVVCAFASASSEPTHPSPQHTPALNTPQPSLPLFFSEKKPSRVKEVFNYCHSAFPHQKWSHVGRFTFVVFIGWFPCVLFWLPQNSVTSSPEVMKWDQSILLTFLLFSGTQFTHL